MTEPRALWILPDREQRGELEIIERGARQKLSEALDVKTLPQELVLGIPESVLASSADKGLVFAQYVRQPEKRRDVFALSVRCGTDRSGRTVYLTGLQILPSGARPVLLPEEPALPEEEQRARGDLVTRFASDTDPWAAAARVMLTAAEREQGLRSFASLPVPQSYFPPDWTPHKKKTSWIAMGAGVLILALGALATALALHAIG